MPENGDIQGPMLAADDEEEVQGAEEAVVLDDREPLFAWVVMVASFSAGCIMGIVYASFALLYKPIADNFGTGMAATGWVGSVFGAASTFPGLLFSGLIKFYGCRVVCIVGGVLFALGLVGGWLSTSLWMLLLSYGLCGGWGYGMVLLSSTIIIQEHFTSSRRSLAAGMSMAGLSIGTMATGPLINHTLEAYGWRGTMLVLAGLALNACVCGCAFRPAYRQQIQRESVGISVAIKDTFDHSLLKSPAVLLYILTNFLITFSLVPLFHHLPNRGYFHGLSRSEVSWLPTCLGFANLSGKLLFSFIGSLRRINRLILFTVLCVLACASSVTATFVTAFPIFLVFCLYNGTFNGGLIGLKPTVLVDVVGVEQQSKGQGLMTCLGGLAALLGTPFAGWLVDQTNSYDTPYFVLGGMEFLAAVFCFGAYYSHSKGNHFI